ncbi:MAG: hypothetical protein UD957_01375 [Evtepia sp.]|nr:hypothetical protein [Evtepia sp.]
MPLQILPPLITTWPEFPTVITSFLFEEVISVPLSSVSVPPCVRNIEASLAGNFPVIFPV